MNGKEEILRIENLSKGYKLGKNFISVLKGVDLSVKKGEWVALLGASGSGKTTLLNIIGCLEKSDQGQVFYDKINYAKSREKLKVKFRRNKVGFVFQSYHLLPELTILENVKLPAMLNGKIGGAATNKAKKLLEQVGLGERLKHKPTELSGGEQQRSAIARALINDPELILADEPTGNLDSKTGKEILGLFMEFKKRGNRTIIMVTHDKEIASLADRIVSIKDGIILDPS